MKIRFTSLIVGTLLAGLFLAVPVSVRAADPDLIDVVEITDTNNPIIVHTNILPGDTFADTMTVINHSGEAQDIAMKLDIIPGEGLIHVLGFELEERLLVSIKRGGVTELLAPGTTLQMLHNTIINLGSIPAAVSPAGTVETYSISVVFDKDAGNEYQNTKVYFNLMISVDVDDAFMVPALLIDKKNDVDPTVQEPGDEVTYTITVTAPESNESDLSDVTVTDVPPAGFVYVPGSGAGASFLHEYASPGVWSLGTMTPGQVKVLTYKTKISDTQDAGLYKDLAWAKGTSQIGTTVLADDESDADNFVGTKVAVALPGSSVVTIPQETDHQKKEKVVKKTKYVLGASTLPMTGASMLPISLAVAFLFLGIFFMMMSKRRRAVAGSIKETPLASWLTVLFVGSFYFFGQPAQAANMAVDIEKPQAVVNDANFQIGFVVLDILGRSITVECYEGASVSPFATYVLSVLGGSSGNCQVNATAMPVPGDYTFSVKAIATSGASETSTSVSVPVRLVASAPGTPYNYNRNDATCQNILSFTTADDGDKTVKVELYRSANTSFTADASTKVDEVVIGSNVAGSFTEAAPSCSNDYFYALRAVDANGFGSGFVADKDVNVDTRTVTRTKTTIVETARTSSGAAVVPGATGGSAGQVQGAETETANNGTAEVEASQPAGSVLGEATLETEADVINAVKNHPWITTLLIILVLVLGYFGYQYTKGKYDHPTE